MNQDANKRKEQLREDLLQAMDERNQQLNLRRFLAPPALGLLVLVGMAMLLPSALQTTPRVPVHVNWIPSVTMDELLESDRIGLVNAISITPPGSSGDLHDIGIREVTLLSTAVDVPRIDDREAASLLELVSKQSS